MDARIRRLLVPLDGSGASRRALPWASELAERTGATITLIQIVPSTDLMFATASTRPMMPMPVVVDPVAQSAEMRSAARRDLEDASELLPSRAGVEIAVGEGAAGDALVRAATEDGTDVIVMATRGQGGLKRALLGSVADEVVRHAPCPVMLVPVTATD